MYVRTSLATLIFVGFGSVSFAHAETLEDALVAAYTGNATLLAQRSQLRATDELVPQALSNWRPTVRVNGGAGVDSTSTNAVVPPTPREQTSFARDATFSISEPLYRGGRTDAQTAQAEATVNAGRQQLAVSEQGVLLGVVSAYLDIIQNQAVVDLNINNEQVLQRQLDATNDRFRVGEVTRTDVAQSQAALSGAHASRLAAQGTLQDSIATFTRLVGHAPKNLEPVPVPPDLPGTLDEANAAAGASNPSVLAQRYTYEASTHAIDLAEGALLPEVDLQGSYGRTQDQSGTGIYSRSAQALVNVTVPIYQSGSEYSVIRQQKQVAGQQRHQLDETRREVVESSTQTWENLQSARARVLSFQEQVKASQIALDGVTRELLVGSRTVLDVLTTEQDLLNARVNLELARHDATLAAYQLKSVAGRLTGKALALPTPIYDPAVHYNEVRDKWIGTGSSPNSGDGAK